MDLKDQEEKMDRMGNWYDFSTFCREQLQHILFKTSEVLTLKVLLELIASSGKSLTVHNTLS